VKEILPLVMVLALAPRAAAAQGCGMPAPAPARRPELVLAPGALARRLAEPGLVVLHLDMERDGFRAAHIPGARWVDPHAFMVTTADSINFELPPVAALDSLIEAVGISDDSRVVLYGEPGHLARVFLALEYAGLGGRVAVLDGGLTAWRAAGHATTAQAEPVRRGAFTPRPAPDIVIDTAALRARLGDRRLALVDARSAEEYDGRQVMGGTRAGHLPGARLLDWSRTFVDPAAANRAEDAALVGDAALRRLFHDAGAASDRDLVLYCTIGLRAAHLYFVARYLGYNPRLYDGSIEAWSRRPDLPLHTGERP
jgi:thiosulfate/3-mercaptopyruvate sulfurtransferase